MVLLWCAVGFHVLQIVFQRDSVSLSGNVLCLLKDERHDEQDHRTAAAQM